MGWGLTCPTVVELQCTLHSECLPTAATAVAVLTVHLLKGHTVSKEDCRSSTQVPPPLWAALVTSTAGYTTVFLLCFSRNILAVQMLKKENPTLR